MSYEEIKNQYSKNAYPFYTKPYDLNIGALRNDSLEVDEFNDIMFVAYTDFFEREIVLQHYGTTKPGLYWLKNKMGNIGGTAILCPGHYRSCWTFGEHKGQYSALVQSAKAEFKVWRDFNSNGKLDMSGPIYRDVQGLNMHTESLIKETEKVGAYSAGCQVRKWDREHFMIMELCKMQRDAGHGIYFSYTLL